MRTDLVALAAACLLSACGTNVPVVEVEAQPSPSPTSETPSPSSTPTPTPTEPPTEASPTPTEVTPHPATDTDRARFVAAYQPEGATGLQHVATDLDGDGTQELVFTYVRGGQRVHVDVAWWTGTTYEVQFDQDGGAGATIDRVGTADVNADGRTEIVTAQSGEGSQASVTVWQVAGPGQVVALPAVGGCHDGSNTYGVTGAELADRDADGADEIYATCDDGTPGDGQPSVDRYRWEAGAYRHAPQVVP